MDRDHGEPEVVGATHATARRAPSSMSNPEDLADTLTGLQALAGNAAVAQAVVQRRERASQGAGPLSPEIGERIDAVRGGGSPLPEDVRSEMEGHLGHDLSPVRIHADGRADELARSVQAEAFTTGRDMFFSSGAYDPGSGRGRELLAHELTHVVQHSKGTLGNEARVTDPNEPAELEAAHIGRTVARSSATAIRGRPLVGPSTDVIGPVLRSPGATATDTRPSPTPVGTVVGKYARVGEVEPFLSLRSSMDHRKVTEATDSLVLAALKFNDRVFVLERYPGEWAKVRTDDGIVGYTWLSKLFVGAPDQRAYLHKIRDGETALRIAQNHYACGEWGRDGRFFVNALVAVNEATGDAEKKRGIFKQGNRDSDAVDSWKDTQLRADYWIWIPSEQFARSLAGTISSGSISYELWQSVKGAVGFVVGVLEGVATTLADLVMGIVDLGSMIVDLIVDIARGGFVAKVKQLIAFLDKLDVEEIASALWSDFKDRWNAEDAYERWNFRGMVVGMVVGEIALAALTGGATLALKAAGKAGRVAKLASKLASLDAVTDFAKGVDRAGDATTAGRSARRVLSQSSDDIPDGPSGGTPHHDWAGPDATPSGTADAPANGSGPDRRPDGGLEFVPSKHADTGLRKLAGSGGDWSKLTGVEARVVGTFLHRVMEGLVAHIADVGWHVVRRETITPAKVAEWRSAGRKVALVEAKIPTDGRLPRLDVAEIDFVNGKVSIMDYVPTSDAAHAAKTRDYGEQLAMLVDLPVSAVDVEYISAGRLVEDLPLPD